MNARLTAIARGAAVVVARLLCGALFILSGWAKAVDPRGFVYKITEYLNVWGISDYIFPGVVLMGAVALSVFELVVGVLLLTGSLRRTAAWCGLAMMAFMLPLTVYIYVADPVADCGCFGDLLVVSNGATLLKNIVATGLLVVCLVWYKAAPPLYRPDLQWLVVALTAIYGIVVALVGWQFQPIVDFRPYPPGSSLVADEEASAGNELYVYERDGERHEFSLDALPDSTWTFVERIDDPEAGGHAAVLELFEGDEEVTYDVLNELAESKALILCVAEPGLNNLTRSRFANELYDYASANDITMIGVVALSGDALAQWEELSLPSYPVYSSSDTSIKELVRGPMGLVYLDNGIIEWKRNFISLPPDLLDDPDPLDRVWRVDSGRAAATLSGIYGIAMGVLLIISTATTITIAIPRLRRRKAEVKNESKDDGSHKTAD